MKRFFATKDSGPVTPTITTNIYTAWTPAVDEFIKAIADKKSLEPLYNWLNTEGKSAFQNAQRDFFKNNIGAYLNEKSPCSEVLFTLSQEQIKEGFKAWHEALLKQFPKLSTEAMKEPFEKLMEECNHDKYHAHIAVRAVLTRQLVLKKESPEFIMASYKTLNIYNEIAIASIQEHLDEQSPKQEMTSSKLS